MKNNNLYIISCILCVFTSCLNTEFTPTEWALDPELDFSNNWVIFNSTIRTDTISVFTNYQSFEATSSEDWCKVSTAPSTSQIIISVEPNINTNPRSASVTIYIKRGNKFLSKVITVVQMGGIWETIGNFNVFWGYEISEFQRDAIMDLLSNMVYVTGGDFVMGNTDEQIVDMTYPHSVSISSFYIGKYEVTQKQWKAVMWNNPASEKGERIPVYNISWAEAYEFISRLSELTHLNISLPTEAQWEFAAIGGLKSNGHIYSGSDDYRNVAIYNESLYFKEPTIVGSMLCNELGLFDMSGNVAEYCFDWHKENFQSDTIDPIGPDSGMFKCVRGGHVNSDNTYYLRTTNRFSWSESINKVTPYTGFRIIISE